MLKTISQKIIKYKNIIIFIWCILILIIFKYTNNFVFKNNSSILFVILFFIVPISLNIIAKKKISKVKQEKGIKKKGYIDKIKFDLKEGMFHQEFLNKLPKMKIKPEVSNVDNQIIVSIGENKKIQVILDEKKTVVHIIDTMIIYRFYYTKTFDELTKYDRRGLEFQPTSKLYQALVDVITRLYSNELLYEEIFLGKEIIGYRLYLGEEIIYQIKEQKRSGLFKREQEIKTEIIL